MTTGMCNINAQTITDADGNSYGTIKIEEQRWMSKDLRTTSCNDRTLIPQQTGAGQGLETPAYSWYGGGVEQEPLYSDYGPLYNWYVVDGCDICPEGSRVPSDADWTALMDYLDPNPLGPSIGSPFSKLIGRKLRKFSLYGEHGVLDRRFLEGKNLFILSFQVTFFKG